MNGELLRIIESLYREKAIDKEIVFAGIESAVASACRKHFGSDEDIVVSVNRDTGEITATDDGQPISPGTLGRIAAQTAKQVMIQKIREAERDVIFNEYEGRIGTVLNGTVQRFEGRSIIVNLGRTEGILPVSEQMRNESYRVGERIQCVVFEVKKVGPRVRIVLSRTSPELVRRLFEIEVPEIAERIIDIRVIAREAGHRTKVAVSSNDPRIDCVGACVGVRGTRIKGIVDELNGEKIDIVRWNDSSEILIMNALRPAEIEKMILDEDVEPRKATIFVREDQLSLAIGRKGQNVRLASKLSNWEIDIVPSEDTTPRLSAETVLGSASDAGGPLAAADESPTLGFPEDLYKALKNGGYRNRAAILAAGVDVLAKLKGMDEDKARLVVRTLVSQALDEVAPVEKPDETVERLDEEVSPEQELESQPAEAQVETSPDDADNEGPESQPGDEEPSEEDIGGTEEDEESEKQGEDQRAEEADGEEMQRQE